MTADDDDEALTWAGGSDPSHVESPEPVRPPRVKRPLRQARGPVGELVEGDARPPATSAAFLLGVGVLAGIYLLYTIGWIVSLQRLIYTATSDLDQVAFHIQQIIAIAAPAIWFASTFWLTANRKPVIRLVWLVVGALALVPWSFVFGV